MATFSGTDGNDTYTGTGDGDTINGKDGNDILSGAGGNDAINGGDGNDIISGGDGNDTINGGDDDDVIGGDDGDDLLSGGKGNDTVDGGAGADTINGNDGDDVLQGGDGADVINGNAGADTISGGDGDDELSGNNDDDVLDGGSGNDTMSGNNGNDSLTGGPGDDDLTGGNHDDTFSFSFVVTQGGSFTFSGWLATQGLSLTGATQSFFSTNYTAWLNHLVAEFGVGSDANDDGVIEVDLQQNSEFGTPLIEGMTVTQLAAMFGDREDLDVITGKTTQTRYFSDSFSMGGATVTSPDGMDVIWDFRASGADMLVFNGIEDAAAFAAHFTVTASASTHGTSAFDTVITLNSDPSWSVTLVDFVGFNPATHVTYMA